MEKIVCFYLSPGLCKSLCLVCAFNAYHCAAKQALCPKRHDHDATLSRSYIVLHLCVPHIVITLSALNSPRSRHIWYIMLWNLEYRFYMKAQQS